MIADWKTEDSALKAFDCVAILADKLEFYGIYGKLLTWIQSHLKKRHQTVLNDKINANDSVSSRWKKLQMGFLGVRSWVRYLFLFILMIYQK